MNHPTPFDGGADPELGAELREALDGPSPDGFLARVKLAVLQAGRRETSWDVLARWSPAGLVAAVAAALLLWMVLRPAEPAGDVAGQLIASAPARMEVAPAQPETDVLLTSLLEGR
ncbi:MAG TPA: hypothetical protein VGA78_12915 [Gemmatimonadales bacterium]|jgi:hypothetical protein